ncbi:MAG TPA: ABC transporter permease [Puia sp.]|jgi:ABC-type antimicrobial peptide transport system permease subunit
MLKNYLRVAWRHLHKNKGYTFINIAGLATGMAITLLIGLWITDEISFNHYHTNHSRIAQAMVIQYSPDEVYNGTTVSVPMAQALRERYPELFTKVAFVGGGGDHLVAVGDKKLTASGIWAGRDFVEMFTLRILKGSIGSMSDPSTALISQSLATALFGKADPTGKTFKYEDKLDLTIGGVFEDLPRNTQFYNQKMILPWGSKENQYYNQNTNWSDHNGNLYVQLADGVTAEQASARIKKLPTPFIKNWREEAMVYPLDKAYLYSDFKNGKPSGGRIQFLWLFGFIGGFVLLLACINFMNLSTARSERRAKEVGIRKTVGSLKRQLVGQFLMESVIVALLAFIISIAIVQLSLPFFNNLAAKDMALPWNNSLFWVLSIGFTLFTGLLAGSYPAFYLSSFDPIRVLKGTFRAGKYAGLPRQALVVLQFSVSLTLIIGTFIVYRQIEYAQDRPVGYKRDGLLTVDINTPELAKHYEALREELLQKGLVADVGGSSMAVTAFYNNNDLEWRGKRPDQATVWFRNVNVTREFGRTIGWTVLQGRDFSRDFATDSSSSASIGAASPRSSSPVAFAGSAILNEAGAKATGIANPVGETMKFFGKNYTVIGVVNDMVTNSPYQKIEPALFLGDGYISTITMRLRPDQPVHAALDALKPVFAKYNPGSPFMYKFTDDDYNRKFADEVRIAHLASVFTTLAIFISCLGLFGLASFVAEQRTKEIGVRKVLGASLFTLWGLLSKEFVKLVVISFFISMPLGYLFMHKWLQTYPYRTALSWWIFALAGSGILLITLLTVSYQSLKAATMNPVKSLRSE